jgi:hypothetical protein
MAKEGCIIYTKEIEEQVNDLSDNEKLRFFLAILAYENRGDKIIKKDEGMLYGFFMAYMQSSERNKRRYEDISNKRREAANARKKNNPDGEA